jgi:hypothetical protein
MHLNVIVKRQRNLRKAKGGMLLLSLASGFLLMLCFYSWFSVLSLFYIQGNLQRLADQVALSGACQLNPANRLGLINEMTARCRQSVYAARSIRQLAQNASLEEQMLADQLLDEDRQDAQDLNTAREQIQTLSTGQASKAISKDFKSEGAHFCPSLPWLLLDKPTLVSVQFGSIARTDSNVHALTGIQELADFDDAMKFVSRDSGLYAGNINAKLPGEDDDLSFQFSSLPAAVNTIVAPARVVLPDVFRVNGKEQLHSAVKVVITVHLRTGVLNPSVNAITVVGTAAANGAQALR